MDLCSLADVKKYIRSASSDDDALLGALISAASSAIQSHLSRDFGAAEVSETLSGRGSSTLLVSRGPILSILSLTIDGVPQLLSSYRASGSRIVLSPGLFPRGTANIDVRYLGGRDVPEAVRDACVQLVALRFAERDRIGFKSKSLAGETVAFAVTEFPVSVTTILNAWRAPVVPL